MTGNLTKDPEMSVTTKTNTAVAHFTAACNGNDETVFMYCKALGKNAENIGKFFKKGRGIVIAGELSQYADKEGKTHTYVLVQNWDFVNEGRGNKPATEPNTNQADTGEESPY